MNTNNTFEATNLSVARFNYVDYAIVLSLLMISLTIGVFIRFSKYRSTTTADFLFAGYKMKSLPVALSLLASQLSPIIILTMPVEIYQYGWQYALFIPTLALVMLALCYIFLPILYENKLDNCYTYLDLRYRPLARHINVVAFTINNFLYLPVIVYIPSLALAELTEWNVHVIHVTVCYVCVAYTTLGGLKAIVSIGLIHTVILVSSIVSIVSLGVYHVGLDKIWYRSIVGERIVPPDLSVTWNRSTFWNLTINTFIVWSSLVSFSQNNIQRIVSVPTLQISRRTVVIFFAAVAVILFLNCSIGLIMYAYYYDCDPVQARKLQNYDKLVPDFIENIAGHINGMTGLFVASLFCAALSIVSPVLHSMAGIYCKDYIRPLKLYKSSDDNAKFTMRLIIFAVGTYCAASGMLVHTFPEVFRILNAITNMTNGAKFGVFTMGFFWPWININGLLSGTVFSMFVVCSLISNAQYHLATGELRQSTMPTSIDGCNDGNFTITKSAANMILFSDADEEFTIHNISFHWFTLIGVICAWIPGVLISHITGGRDLTNFNYRLFSPWIERWLPRQCLHTTLKQISIVNDEEEKNKLLIQ